MGRTRLLAVALAAVGVLAAGCGTGSLPTRAEFEQRLATELSPQAAAPVTAQCEEPNSEERWWCRLRSGDRYGWAVGIPSRRHEGGGGGRGGGSSDLFVGYAWGLPLRSDGTVDDTVEIDTYPIIRPSASLAAVTTIVHIGHASGIKIDPMVAVRATCPEIAVGATAGCTVGAPISNMTVERTDERIYRFRYTIPPPAP